MSRATARRRERLIARDGLICALCGKPMSEDTATIDHIFPKSRGGTNDMKNLRLAHKRCNGLRGDKFTLKDALLWRPW